MSLWGKRVIFLMSWSSRTGKGDLDPTFHSPEFLWGVGFVSFKSHSSHFHLFFWPSSWRYTGYTVTKKLPVLSQRHKNITAASHHVTNKRGQWGRLRPVQKAFFSRATSKRVHQCQILQAHLHHLLSHTAPDFTKLSSGQIARQESLYIITHSYIQTKGAA
jgi:hypothetical protein